LLCIGEIEPVGSVEISIAGFVVGTGVGGCDSNVGLAVEKLGEHSEKFALLVDMFVFAFVAKSALSVFSV
jgi:hypothetical protein